MGNLIKKLVRFALCEEINEIEDQKHLLERYIDSLKRKIDKVDKTQKTFEELLSNFDCSIDIHTSKYSNSWAVISLQGQKSDYLKFIDLGDKDLREITKFLRQFERQNFNIKIDAAPDLRKFTSGFKI